MEQVQAGNPKLGNPLETGPCRQSAGDVFRDEAESLAESAKNFEYGIKQCRVLAQLADQQTDPAIEEALFAAAMAMRMNVRSHG